MSEVVFRAVPRLEVPSIWPEAAAVLAPALERPGLAGLYTADDMLSRLTDARMQLWVAESDGAVKTACLTQVETHPRAKVLQIVAVAGDGFGLWREWLDDVAAWARAEGCRFIHGNGRDGWKRRLEAAGLHKLGTMYSVTLA